MRTALTCNYHFVALCKRYSVMEYLSLYNKRGK
nr:MAG TPA: hypothetical protein [Caudoviricetes sp.]